MAENRVQRQVWEAEICFGFLSHALRIAFRTERGTAANIRTHKLEERPKPCLAQEYKNIEGGQMASSEPTPTKRFCGFKGLVV